MRLHTTVMLAAAALLALLSLHATPASGAASLRAARPDITRSEFEDEGETGLLYAQPSLFGLPNYQAELQGMLQRPANDKSTTNLDGCAAYPTGWLPAATDKGTVPVTIALVKRGGCTFGVKAMAAQEAGASAIIVYNDATLAKDASLPHMAGGALTEKIAIPGFFITLEDGQKLDADVTHWLEAAAEPAGSPPNVYKQGIWMSLSYSLVAPDDRVEWDLYIVPDEAAAVPILQTFLPAVESIDAKGFFTPHFKIIDGDQVGCLPDPSDPERFLPCGNQCTNSGLYCRVDPNGNSTIRPDGADVVREAIRQKCLSNWSMEVVQPPQPMLWWNYANQRVKLDCRLRSDVEACTAAALSAASVPAAAVTWIEDSCIGDTGETSTELNQVAEDELQYYYDWQPPRSPWLFVNNEAYTGSFTCGSPANPATCGPLSMICQGFMPGTAPAVCNANTCDAGVQRDACGVCGGGKTDASQCNENAGAGKSSFPVGAVIGVVIVCCVLIGGGVYWYMRRQNSKMRDDIDSLLKQYLPLDGQQSLNGSSAANGSIKSPSHARDPNSNLRLIGNLDAGGDEPTDL